MVEKEGPYRENCYYHDNEIALEKDVNKMRRVCEKILCMLNEFFKRRKSGVQCKESEHRLGLNGWRKC